MGRAIRSQGRVHGIPRNAKGVSALRKQVLAVEKLKIQINQERKMTAEAEECSTLLTEKVATQEQELITLKVADWRILTLLVYGARCTKYKGAKYEFCWKSTKSNFVGATLVCLNSFMYSLGKWDVQYSYKSFGLFKTFVRTM